MLTVQIPEDIQTVLEKKTTDLIIQKEERKKENKEILNKAKKILSFLQDIAKEPIVINYLQAGRKLRLLAKKEHQYLGFLYGIVDMLENLGYYLECDRYNYWLELCWDGSPKVVLVSPHPYPDYPFDLSLDLLEKWNEDKYWCKVVCDLSKTSKEEIWKKILKHLRRS